MAAPNLFICIPLTSYDEALSSIFPWVPDGGTPSLPSLSKKTRWRKKKKETRPFFSSPHWLLLPPPPRVSKWVNYIPKELGFAQSIEVLEEREREKTEKTKKKKKKKKKKRKMNFVL